MSPVSRVPIVQLVSHVILALSLVFNVGININYNHFKEDKNMVKTTNKQGAVKAINKVTTELGCVGNRARKSG